MGNLGTGIVSIALAIIGLATIAVVFSKNADTAGVVKASAGGLAQDISAAVSPITGNTALNFGNGIA
jgi:hypothetical protein